MLTLSPVIEPQVFTSHLLDRVFIGQSVCEVLPGELWMFTSYGRKPTDFCEADLECFSPQILKSYDGGRTWGDATRMAMEWDVDGWLSDGGSSVLRLRSGKLLFVAHRYSSAHRSSGSHGVPVQSSSHDDGQTWSPARLLVEQDDIFYVMNQRLIQLENGPYQGRLVLPVSGRDVDIPLAEYGEGVHPCLSRCFLSDDEGDTWRLSKGTVRQFTDRGAQEPCVVQCEDGRLLMLFRSGVGTHQRCYSHDGGETWSQPESTGLEAACSPLTLTSTREGTLILAYNPAQPLFEGSYYPRNPLAYTTSDDGGLTWSQPIVVDSQENQQLIYPSITLTKEGLLLAYCAYLDPGNGSFDFEPDTMTRTGGGKVCLMPFPHP